MLLPRSVRGPQAEFKQKSIRISALSVAAPGASCSILVGWPGADRDALLGRASVPAWAARIPCEGWDAGCPPLGRLGARWLPPHQGPSHDFNHKEAKLTFPD